MYTKYTILLLCCTLIGITNSEALDAQTSYAQAYNHTTRNGNNGQPIVSSPHQIITMSISASTNTCAITMSILSTDETTYQVCNAIKQTKLPTALTQTLFSDAYAAHPLDKLPVASCMKSASFGTTTHIWLQRRESPDVSCSTDTLGKKLNVDVQSIRTTLHIMDARRSYLPFSTYAS